MKTNVIKQPLKATSGTYAGNDTADRAIPHSLSKVPKLVLLASIGASSTYNIHGEDPGLIRKDNGSALVVTEMDATNFYVGDAAGYANSANLTGVSYCWVAIG